MTAAVTVTDLSVSYGDVRALVDVSLRLAPGRVHGLVGMNGSGKSTLFKALTNAADLDHATVTGTVDVDRPAYVPQSEHVDWTFPVSVRDVVTMGRRGHTGILGRPRARDRAAVDAALARTGLTDLAGRQIGRLSGGQRRRAFVARGIAQEAEVMLLDEPFAGVDAASQRDVSALLRELADEGRCILIATHDLPSVPALCDTVTMLHRSVVAHGAPAEVLTPETLVRTFGMDPTVPPTPEETP